MSDTEIDHNNCPSDCIRSNKNWSEPASKHAITDEAFDAAFESAPKTPESIIRRAVEAAAPYILAAKAAEVRTNNDHIAPGVDGYSAGFHYALHCVGSSPEKRVTRSKEESALTDIIIAAYNPSAMTQEAVRLGVDRAIRFGLGR